MAAATCCANGVKSVADSGTRIEGDVVALAAEDGLDGGGVALAEGVVLREDDDLLARRLAEERVRGEHVLVGLPAGPERVPVEAGDHVVAAAAPEMYRTWFCAASGASCSGDRRRAACRR